jgi:HK97 family phage portal protein
VDKKTSVKKAVKKKTTRKKPLKVEKRGNVDDPQYWIDFFNRLGYEVASGKYVTPENALQISAVFACVRVLAESIASLPLIVYRKRKDGGKDIADGHYLYPILHNSPNAMQTSFEFREMLMGHVNLRGNAFSYMEFDGAGRIANLVPLNAANMTVKKENGKIIYDYVDEETKHYQFPPEVIWHWKGISNDGLTGMSPVQLARETLGLAMSVEEHGARFFSNFGQQSGFLTFPGKLNEDARKKLRESMQEASTGKNKWKMGILEGGLDWKSVGMSNDDAQFLATRQFQVEDIARIYRVPPMMIGHPDKTATYASAEQFFLAFVVHTIRPWTVRLEQSKLKHLFTEREREQGYFAEYKMDGLLRGDVKTRYEAYTHGRNWGWLSVNDIRKLENLNPVENGDIYLQPLNMVEAGEKPEPQEDIFNKDLDKVTSGNNGGKDAGEE